MITYDTILSSFLGKITDYDFLEVDEEYIYSKITEWLNVIFANPVFRKLFGSVIIDPDERTVVYTMGTVTSADDSYNDLFVVETLSLGLVVEWLNPQIKSQVNIKQVFSGKEEKYYSQAAHLAEIRALYESSKSEFYKHIRDYGTYNNSYIKG